jgi:adenylyl- and sulfurtransferase ThiI
MPVIVRYAEIGIKGKNRTYFEKALMNNIEACLRENNAPFSKIKRFYGRIFIETENCCSCLKRVFGIASFSTSVRAGTTIDEAFEATKSQVANLAESESFRITCTRVDKRFPLTSKDVCVQLGDKLRTATKARVKMSEPTVNVELEVLDGAIHVLTKRTEGPGGMPLGTAGKVLALIEDDASVLAALLVMKRGCTVIPVMEQTVDISLLKKFACGFKIEPVPKSAEIDALAELHKAIAVVLNDTGASRPIALKALALRPLSGMMPSEIDDARRSFESMSKAD